MRSLASTVLQTALQQAQAWRQAGLDISVAVNLSVANLIDTHLPVEVGNVLAAFGLPASALELEITETTLMVDPVRSGEVLGALRALGVRIAVDDYGTGYSSLAYLQQLAVDELKLDKSFILPMLRTRGSGDRADHHRPGALARPAPGRRRGRDRRPPARAGQARRRPRPGLPPQPATTARRPDPLAPAADPAADQPPHPGIQPSLVPADRLSEIR
jgi:hypothetical protein